MDVTYRHRVDVSFYRTLVDRYYRQRPLPLRPVVQFGVLALTVAALILGAAHERTPVIVGTSLGVAALILFGGVYLTKLSIIQRFKSRADFGTEATIVLSEAGIASHGAHSEGKWAWAAYPRAVRFPDGILLLRRGVIRWLPNSGIQGGDANAAAALVARKTKMRNIA
jgi:hypothetical protein